MNDKAFTRELLESAKPKDTKYRLYAGQKYYVLISPKGRKTWQYDYQLDGKRKTISLGTYPDVDLDEIEEVYHACKNLVEQGLDPVAEKKRLKALGLNLTIEDALTFEAVAWDWYSKEIASRAESTRQKIWSQLKKDVFPFIGDQLYAALTRDDYIEVLRRIEKRKAYAVARDVASHCKRIAKYACVACIVKSDVTTGLDKCLTPEEVKHRPAITDPIELGHFLRVIEGYTGEISTFFAL